MNPSISRVRILLAIAIAALAVILVLRLRLGEKNPEAAIRKVIDDQQEAWNRGDLEGFMDGYWKSEELTFFSGGDVRLGWNETYERYRKKYKGPPREPLLAPINLLALPLSTQGLAPAAPPLGAAAQRVSALAVLDSDVFTPEMGRLEFEGLRVILTGPKSAVVRGRWGLTFQHRPPVGGLFTLLFREEAQGWCIVHDHTS